MVYSKIVIKHFERHTVSLKLVDAHLIMSFLNAVEIILQSRIHNSLI